jgi:hypothetical protein
MTGPKNILGLALILLAGALGFSAQTKAAESRCSHSLEQYTGYARELASFASRARQQADKNPLYESDAQYYATELADAQLCIKTLAPSATVFR